MYPSRAIPVDIKMAETERDRERARSQSLAQAADSAAARLDREITRLQRSAALYAERYQGVPRSA